MTYVIPDCDPPCTFTEPEPSLTRRFLAPTKFPVVSWTQLPPSRYTRFSWHRARDASALITTATPASLMASLNECPPDLCSFLIHLRHLRQHRAGLRTDRNILIRLRQPGQHRAHVAVSFHRFNQAQRLHSDARIRVAHQRAQNPIPHLRILPHEAAQSIQCL